jgi:hypothetical protein
VHNWIIEKGAGGLKFSWMAWPVMTSRLIIESGLIERDLLYENTEKKGSINADLLLQIYVGKGIVLLQ